MILASRILAFPHKDDPVDFGQYVSIPETYFIGSDVYYDFKAINGFEQFTSQKYQSHETIEREYPLIREAYLEGRFPENITRQLREILIKIGNSPIIIRSSSLLEDNFGSSFAGKYDSFFLPNQGTLEENMEALIQGVVQVYASVIRPDALFYRKIQGLDDYDERMAILIQKVEGNRHGDYFFPFIGGVGFSRNPFIWNTKLKQEDGFLRMVFGLGTRAVDRVDDDYPRMIGLSHPQLRPEKDARSIKKYSQRHIDAIQLSTNSLVTLPVTDVLNNEFPGVQYLASIHEGDFIKPIYSLGSEIPPDKLVLTFENLLKNTNFVNIMRGILRKLEYFYERPVDIEFAIHLIPKYPQPELKIVLLQCRPLSNRIAWSEKVVIPTKVAKRDQIFSANHLVPQGVVEKIKYIVYVDPELYSQIADNKIQHQIARIVGRLNKRLEGEDFILMGPGRWGSSNIDLGVQVSYADIYNSKMLIEIAVSEHGVTPEVSYGTHFFQDLVESNIYPLSLYPDDSSTVFNKQYLAKATNQLPDLLPNDADYIDYVKVIDVPQTSQGKYLWVVMNGKESEALGYLNKEPEAPAPM